MNKHVYLGTSILESKILMRMFWYDYVKPKYGEQPELCYMDTNSFIEGRFDTSSYELDRPLPKRKNWKIKKELMKDELGQKITKKVFGLRAKTYR